MPNAIFTHDEAANIVELFEDILDRCNITLPSPEDGEREPDNETRLYGTTYSELLDDVEDALIDILERHTEEAEVVIGIFS